MQRHTIMNLKEWRPFSYSISTHSSSFWQIVGAIHTGSITNKGATMSLDLCVQPWAKNTLQKIPKDTGFNYGFPLRPPSRVVPLSWELHLLIEATSTSGIQWISLSPLAASNLYTRLRCILQGFLQSQWITSHNSLINVSSSDQHFRPTLFPFWAIARSSPCFKFCHNIPT